MKKQYLHKLKNYSALSSAFLCLAGKTEGQIIYTDIDPDISVNNDEVNFDFDNDGAADFKFIFVVETGNSFIPSELKLRINPLGEHKVGYAIQTIPVTYSGSPWSTYTAGATELLFTVAPVINSGEIIDGALNFQTDIANLYQLLYFNVYSSYDFEAFKPGDWMDQTNKFAAIQFSVAGEDHFGWIRLSVDLISGITVHDFAYEAIANSPIITKVVNYSPNWIFANDLGITGTGADIQFSFNAPADEADILSYRIICVKADVADTFTTEIANDLIADQYIEITPDGSPVYTSAFSALSQDSDGDLITTSQPYHLFILNVMDPATDFANMISIPSAIIELIDTVLPVVDNALNDISNLGNGADMKVSFDSPETEQGIDEYRVIIVKKDDADAFTLEDAELLSPDKYTSVATGLEDYIVFLNATTLDSDGDLIEPAKYKSFVLSYTDGTSASINALSTSSAALTIETNTSIADPILLQDVGENGNGDDIKVSFPYPVFEQTVDEYRIYLVDFVTAFDFDVAAALAVPLSNYTSIIPNATDIVINGNTTLTDTEGNLITWGVPYYAYVLSIAGQYGINDTLSLPSNQLIINYPVIININEEEIAEVNIFSDNDQIHVTINSAVIAKTNFTLVNTLGEIIFEKEVTQQENVFTLNIPEGIYLAHVQTNGNIYSKLLFVHKK